MGGSAFQHAVTAGELTLNTPRMTAQEYANLKSVYLPLITAYFQTQAGSIPADRTLASREGSRCQVADQQLVSKVDVRCLIEAPEKSDYGDMDVLVASGEEVDFIDLANRVGTAGVVCRGEKQCSLAVNRDGSKSTRPAVVYKEAQDEVVTALSEELYAQIDVAIIEPALLEWYLFYSSYGDMVGLLGRIVTNFGFKVSDRGLWLRLKELDHSKTLHNVQIPDKDGLIFLSRDPKEAMRFLGLSPQAFEAGFNTLDELFEWLSRCRLVCAEGIKLRRDTGTERQREQKRKIYTQFFNEWLPSHKDITSKLSDEEQAQKLQDLRVTLQDEAVQQFSKQDEFDVVRGALLLRVHNTVAANLLRPLVAKHSGRNTKGVTQILSAFKCHVAINASGELAVMTTLQPAASSQLHRLLSKDGESLKDLEATDAWVAAHWEEVRGAQKKAKAGV